MTEFRADNVTDWAAALTYYGVLSIFPALIALISVVGLLGSSATSSLLSNLRSFTPGPAKDILTNAVTGLSKNQSTGGILFVVGLLLALWSASGYVAAFMRAANSIWDAPEGRPIWKTLPIRLAVTTITVIVRALPPAERPAVADDHRFATARCGSARRVGATRRGARP